MKLQERALLGPQHPYVSLRAVLAACFVLANCLGTRAIIVGPYSVDSKTVHLWHLDEGAVPTVDAAPGGTNLTVLLNGASLTNLSYPGFGFALTTTSAISSYLAASTLINGASDDVVMTYADAATGAFTVEALVRVDIDVPTFARTVPLSILCLENDGSTDRPFQFRVLPRGTTLAGTSSSTIRLHFFNSNGSQHIVGEIPTNGPDAMVQGHWYHVAATFDGAAAGGHAKLYWTLLDPGRTQANQIGSGTMNNLNPLATGHPDLCLGNVGRGTLNANWIGMVDEVRISSVARTAAEMMFNSASATILTDPASQTVAVGQPASFSVLAGGTPPLFYQWRTNETGITGATQSVYTIASAQLSDAAGYDVVVSNAANAVTSTVATLTVRVPRNLTWLGSASADWNTNDLNWDSNADLTADAAYAPGDHVLFDNSGVAQPGINLPFSVSPSSVRVTADSDYLFTTPSNTAIIGNCALTKEGTGNLTLDTDNAYSGPTVIQAGSVIVGAGASLGAGATRGALGTGPITNHAVLRFDRVGTLTIANSVAGNGDLVKDNTLSLLLLGTNSMSGNVTIARGNLTLGPAGLGNSTNVVINGVGAGTGTSLSLRGGAVLSSNVALWLTSSLPDNRCSVIGDTGTNIVDAALVLDGAASISLNAAAGPLEVNGPVTGPNFTDFFTLRGSVTGSVLRSTVILPNGKLQKTDLNTWTVSSTNCSYLYLRMLGGTVKLGNDNALATDAYLDHEQGASTLDLAGFNQTFSGLTSLVANGLIANSSTNRDSRLTIFTTNAWVYGSVVADSTGGGTRKVSLTLSGGSLTLTNANTYSGDTTVSSGTLALAGLGRIPNSTPITLAAGTALDATTRNDGSFTIGSSQVLKGSGVARVLGDLVNDGTIELTLSKVGVTLSNDAIIGISNLSYGGSLKLDITASPALAAGDAFTLFTANTYTGAFASVLPPAPTFGLRWDTSTLATDGTLRVATVATNPTNLTAQVTGGGSTLELSWPLDHLGWSLQVQTNALSAGLGSNWVRVPASAATNQMLLPIDKASGCLFYRLVYP